MNGLKAILPFGRSVDFQGSANAVSHSERHLPTPALSLSSRRGESSAGFHHHLARCLVERTSRTTELAAGCSLSPWERVRVRGTGLPFDIATRTLPEMSNFASPPGRAGGFL